MIYPITISTNTLIIVIFFQHAQKHYIEGGPGTLVIPIKVWLNHGNTNKKNVHPRCDNLTNPYMVDRNIPIRWDGFHAIHVPHKLGKGWECLLHCEEIGRQTGKAQQWIVEYKGHGCQQREKGIHSIIEARQCQVPIIKEVPTLNSNDTNVVVSITCHFLPQWEWPTISTSLIKNRHIATGSRNILHNSSCAMVVASKVASPCDVCNSD